MKLTDDEYKGHMPDKPKNLAEAFEALGNSTLKDHQRWQLLALILSEMCLASGIDLELPIDYTNNRSDPFAV